MRLAWTTSTQVLLLVTSLMLPPAAVAVRAEDNPERGGQLYLTCSACHGAQAEGNKSMGAPRLNHLAPVYIVEQLRKFKSGIRGGSTASATAQQMAPMAATLADEQAMYDTAAYIVTLQGKVSAATVEGDIEMGASYYQQYCAACHGPAAGGNLALNSPRLAGSDDWYLSAQMHAFRSGTRGSQSEDRTGRQMRAMAGVLPDDDAVAAVIAYIRGIHPQ